MSRLSAIPAPPNALTTSGSLAQVFSPTPGQPGPEDPMAYKTPDLIRVAIAQAGGGFRPDAAHPMYKEYEELWKLYLDLMELDSKKIEERLIQHAGEKVDKFKLRKQLAACFNLIPSVTGMIRDYVFSEEPTIDVSGDKDLEAFLNDCDGKGTKFAEFVKHRVLPLALCHGMVDVLIENPFIDDPVLTENQAVELGAKPVASTISVLQRINWSVRANGEYNWVCFEAVPVEDANPFARNRKPVNAFITLSAHNASIVPGQETGFWLRSWKQNMLPDTPAAAQLTGAGGVTPWQTIGDFVPTKRVPVASLFFQKSLDHRRPHWPVSKIAMMAVLTKLMIQVLSWTEEDILSNLSVITMPGPAPKDETGKPKEVILSPDSILWTNPDAKNEAKVLQGAVDHVRVKMEFVSAIVQEILRLAHLIGVSAEVEKVTSGVQGMVLRNELFQELATLSGSLDAFTYEILALVKSWATNEDWTKERLLEEIEPTVAFKKEGFTIEPLDNLVDTAQKLISMFQRTSPAMVKAVQKLVAREVLYSEDSALEDVMEDIDTQTDKVLEDAAAAEDAAGQRNTIRKGAMKPPAEENASGA